jgi:hypothetical protein
MSSAHLSSSLGLPYPILSCPILWCPILWWSLLPYHPIVSCRIARSASSPAPPQTDNAKRQSLAANIQRNDELRDLLESRLLEMRSGNRRDVLELQVSLLRD